jgi:hypothetical protein
MKALLELRISAVALGGPMTRDVSYAFRQHHASDNNRLKVCLSFRARAGDAQRAMTRGRHCALPTFHC